MIRYKSATLNELTVDTLYINKYHNGMFVKFFKSEKGFLYISRYSEHISWFLQYSRPMYSDEPG